MLLFIPTSTPIAVLAILIAPPLHFENAWQVAQQQSATWPVVQKKSSTIDLHVGTHAVMSNSELQVVCLVHSLPNEKNCGFS